MDGFSREELSAKQTEFWSKCDATIDGMLGGFGHIHDVDSHGSLEFIRELLPAEAIAKGRALDVGAGIGRVTRHVLLPAGFPTVDLVDACPKFLQTARESIDPARAGDFMASSFADFPFGKVPSGGWSASASAPSSTTGAPATSAGSTTTTTTTTTITTDSSSSTTSASTTGAEPTFPGGPSAPRTWTLVWMQWCAIYLRDDEFGEFFAKACASLDTHGPGFVVLKENILRHGTGPIPDNDDHSVTRADEHLKRMWAEAGVEVVAQKDQRDLPSGLFPVRMYALRLKKKN